MSQGRRRSAARGSVASAASKSARGSCQVATSFEDGDLAALVAADALAEAEHASPSSTAPPSRAAAMMDREGRQPWSRDPRCQLCFLGRHHSSALLGLPTCPHVGKQGVSSRSRAEIFFGRSAQNAKVGAPQPVEAEFCCGLRTVCQSEGEKTASERAQEAREHLDRSAALSRHLLFDERGDPIPARWSGLHKPGRVWVGTGVDTTSDSQTLWQRHASLIANDHMCYGTPPNMSIRKSVAVAAAAQASKQQSRGSAGTSSVKLTSSAFHHRASKLESPSASQVGTPRGVPVSDRLGLAARPP